MERAWLGVLALLLLAPAAAASTGTIVVDAPVTFPSDATARSAEVLGLWLNGTSGLATLTLTAPTLVVHTYHAEYACADTPAARVRELTKETPATYTVHDARATLTKEIPSAGWLGVYATSSTTIEAQSRLEVETLPAETLGNSPRPESAPDPARPAYSVLVPDAHESWTTAGTITVGALAALKLDGPDIQIASRENTTTHATGEELTNAPPLCSTTIDLVVLEPQDGQLRIVTSWPARIATQRATVAWQGSALFLNATGTIRTPEGERALQHEGLLLDGNYSADVAPSTRGSASTSVLTFTGEEHIFVPTPPETDIVTQAAATVGFLALGLALGGLGVLAWSHFTGVTMRTYLKTYERARAHVEIADLLLAHERYALARWHLLRALYHDPRIVALLVEHPRFEVLRGKRLLEWAIRRAQAKQEKQTA